MPSRIFHRNFWATFMIDTIGLELRHHLAPQRLERLELLEQVDHLFLREAGLLGLGRATQIAVRAHAGANRAAHQPVPVQFALHVCRINVRGVFHRNLDGFKSPPLESLEKFGALVGER